MPRRPRLFVPGAIYHVYCRVARGEFVFDEHDEAVEFIETLREVRDLDGLTIFAWCLMGNHDNGARHRFAELVRRPTAESTVQPLQAPLDR